MYLTPPKSSVTAQDITTDVTVGTFSGQLSNLSSALNMDYMQEIIALDNILNTLLPLVPKMIQEIFPDQYQKLVSLDNDINSSYVDCEDGKLYDQNGNRVTFAEFSKDFQTNSNDRYAYYYSNGTDISGTATDWDQQGWLRTSLSADDQTLLNEIFDLHV